MEDKQQIEKEQKAAEYAQELHKKSVARHRKRYFTDKANMTVDEFRAYWIKVKEARKNKPTQTEKQLLEMQKLCLQQQAEIKHLKLYIELLENEG